MFKRDFTKLGIYFLRPVSADPEDEYDEEGEYDEDEE